MYKIFCIYFAIHVTFFFYQCNYIQLTWMQLCHRELWKQIHFIKNRKSGGRIPNNVYQER